MHEAIHVHLRLFAVKADSCRRFFVDVRAMCLAGGGFQKLTLLLFRSFAIGAVSLPGSVAALLFLALLLLAFAGG